ncbi:hypothetical protein [Blastococcus mobilis]|uniref:Uncharacterized protein n=1 Tax=Blastococcus mobilis TaxID=1938746 RepID=A0A238VHS5_9ACTN|nr:hypothetical protein [Blastococcus mobilis]SNR33049.1 hypothetical protein SAMN06272737_10384 [Blastococcus mobilis]
MSQETTDALEAAVRAHVADEGEGAYLTDWVLIAAGAMPEDPHSTTYITESSDGPIHHRTGLVRYLACRTDQLLTDDED